jgi:stage IV sporulation protein FB
MNRGIALSPGAVLVLSLIYFFGGISSLGAVLLSAAVHELGHAAAIKLCGGKVKRLSFDSSGLCMTGAGTYSTGGEMFILLAGPVAGLALAFACSKLGNDSANDFFLRTAGISFALTIYNMLPALPLDGGRALLIIIQRFTEAKIAERIMQCMSIITALVLALIGIYSHNTQAGAAFLAASVCLLIAQI